MRRTYLQALTLFSLVAFSFFSCINEKVQPVEIPPGRSSFIFTDYAPLSDKPVKVFMYRPQGSLHTMPVLFVMHGTHRNADEYRDNWIDLSEEYDLLIVAPEFSEEHYPGSSGYNLGGMFDSSGDAVDERYWAYSIIEPIFDRVVKMAQSQQSSYSIFGHSAGAQFTHRFFLFKDNLRTNHVVSANAGWYAMPDFEIEFPYGLKNTAADANSLGSRLKNRLLIQLGQQDNDPNHEYLRTTAEANAQGAHRLERGQNFYNKARAMAQSLGVTSGWSIRIVPDVGHDNAKMAEDIAGYLFSK